MSDPLAELERLNAVIAGQMKLKEELELAVKLYNDLGSTAKLAITLRGKFPPRDKEDGWYYEINRGIHDWTRPAHKEWWNRANKIIQFLSKENVGVDNIDRFIREAL